MDAATAPDALSPSAAQPFRQLPFSRPRLHLFRGGVRPLASALALAALFPGPGGGPVQAWATRRKLQPSLSWSAAHSPPAAAPVPLPLRRDLRIRRKVLAGFLPAAAGGAGPGLQRPLGMRLVGQPTSGAVRRWRCGRAGGCSSSLRLDMVSSTWGRDVHLLTQALVGLGDPQAVAPAILPALAVGGGRPPSGLPWSSSLQLGQADSS